jgi:hypothetical protein
MASRPHRAMAHHSSGFRDYLSVHDGPLLLRDRVARRRVLSQGMVTRRLPAPTLIAGGTRSVAIETELPVDETQPLEHWQSRHRSRHWHSRNHMTMPALTAITSQKIFHHGTISADLPDHVVAVIHPCAVLDPGRCTDSCAKGWCAVLDPQAVITTIR